jgi:nucleotide-binding universal stress UspA family protein
MDRIVVPLDGTDRPERALRPAFAAARRAGATVTLLSCERASLHAERLHYLNGRAAMVDLPVDTMVVDASPADAIVHLAESDPATLVFMATRGRSRLPHLGTTAEKVLAGTEAPVVLVGPRSHASLVAGERGLMVLGVSEESSSEAVLGHAASLAGALDMDICLVEVVGPEERVPDEQRGRPDRPTASGHDRLSRLSAQLADHGVERIRTEVLYGAEVAASLVHFATRSMASIVAMASHGRLGLDLLARPSTMLETVANSPCPVLTVRCRDPR